MKSDPFAHLVSENPAGPRETVDDLLASARREWFLLRKSFVQWPRENGDRPNMLAKFVRGRQERALDAFLLLHALRPILTGNPLPLATWGRALSLAKPCDAIGASRAFNYLHSMGLVDRQLGVSAPIIVPLLEDGSGLEWHRSGPSGSEVGKGYFAVPHAYWTGGFASTLKLPGKAMLLIMLAETGQNASFAMAVERASEWYGISERTAERGYNELSAAGLLLVHRQLVADARHPLGRREVYHRALVSPFSTEDRRRLQEESRPARRKSARHPVPTT